MLNPARPATSMPIMLVVEDNPDHLELTLTAVQENGSNHDIVVARDGLEALNYLFCQGPYSDRNPAHQPELVLLDLGLPKINGLELMQRMREDPRTFSVPVVMLTSGNEQSDAVLALQGGLNSFACKPLDYRDFKDKLRQVREYTRSARLAPFNTIRHT
ncbi:response regulator [Polaromonas sp. SM01]|uniref:response regulator n=1 Tax=Polaromonas sp. SM01 TaxID=3085630 RepID=UPI00298233C5|nr:response regulator [Polaromonas sp. SM01]MDW5441968.1 response regulator [Polaromonas sp. SM01]